MERKPAISRVRKAGKTGKVQIDHPKPPLGMTILSYLIDLSHYLAALGKDLRFRPEMLTLETDGWTMVTGCFDTFKDPAYLLREEMDAFVLGYHALQSDSLRCMVGSAI